MPIIVAGILLTAFLLDLMIKGMSRMKKQTKQIKAIEVNQEKILREQERQNKELEKHEKRINDLEFKAEQAESDIEFQTDRLADLEAALDYALMQRDSAIPGTKTFEKYQARIVTLKNQIHTAESKLNRANHIKSEAEREIGA